MIAKRKEWINGILLLLTLMVNAMGAFGLINNLSQKEVSDMYQTLITPSPSTFSIWSVIYTLLIISIVVMIIKKEDTYFNKATEEISYLFWISCALNIIWIVSFSYNFIGLSTIFILAFSIVMVLIVQVIGKIQTQNRFLLPITFGLYAGWLFIATVVNIAAWLVKIKWGGLGISPEIWSCVILLVAIAFSSIVLLKTQNAIFPLPIAWAYFGIYNFLNASDGFDGAYKILPIIALIGVVLLIGMSAIQLYKNKYAIMPKIKA
ncbi:MAG: tryptophan-rich sensory protein [Clostridiales bacterium]|nr:tryptophan-rich sensory protein [Clostridiales bacterium]